LSLLICLAQNAGTNTEAQWVNVVLNGGAMGLLAYMAVFVLPKLIAYLRDMMMDWQTVRDKDRDRDDVRFEKLLALFKSEQLAERQSCERKFDHLLEQVRASHEMLVRVVTLSSEHYAEAKQIWKEFRADVAARNLRDRLPPKEQS
jgi:hypothetical protein